MIYSDGLDGLVLDLDELAELDDDVIFDMLEAAGEVVAEAQRQKITSLGLVDTGLLRDSIKVDHKMRGYMGGVRYINVYPQGAHHVYQSRVKTKAYKRSKHGRTYTYGGGTKTATAAEVAFIHEFGAPGRNIPAKQWMRTANEECADEAVSAEFKVYDDYLKSQDF